MNFHRYLLFLLTSLSSVVVNMLSRILLNQWFGYSVSIIIAYTISSIVAYLLARYYVFNESSPTIGRSAFKFALVNIFGMVQVWFISVTLAFYVFPYYGFSHYVPEIAQFMALSSLTLTSYYLHKYFSFSHQ